MYEAIRRIQGLWSNERVVSEQQALSRSESFFPLTLVSIHSPSNLNFLTTLIFPVPHLAISL